MLNSCNIRGRLVADVILKYGDNGEAYCYVTIANNEVYIRNGEKQEHTSFIKCYLFGKGAEALAQYKKKGELVTLTGALKTRPIETKNGNKFNEYILKVEHADFS